MEIVRWEAGFDYREDVVRLAAEGTVIVRCTDANTVLVLASLSGRLLAPVGAWLVVTAHYPAALAARDVATLAALVPLAHVVVESADLAEPHAAILAAMLTNDEVNISNDVATIVGAYNRPAPPQPVTVWRYATRRLVSGDDVLSEGRRETGNGGTLTLFS